MLPWTFLNEQALHGNTLYFLLTQVTQFLSGTYRTGSGPADYSTTVCTIHMESIWRIVRPIGNYVELTWVALSFHFGRL